MAVDRRIMFRMLISSDDVKLWWPQVTTWTRRRRCELASVLDRLVIKTGARYCNGHIQLLEVETGKSDNYVRPIALA